MFAVQKVIRAVTGKYTDKEIKQIQAVQNYYRLFVDDKKLPDELNIGEKFDNRLRTHPESYSNTHWLNANQGNMGREAYDLITMICDYQNSRTDRIVGDGNADDPTNLVLHHLKNWLVTLAIKPFNPDTLAETNKMCQYIQVIYRDPEIFEQSHTLSMKRTLIRIHEYLREKVVSKIEIEIANQSAYEKIIYLNNHLKSFFDSSIYFLYYIFRNSNPDNISIEKIKSPDEKTKDEREDDYTLELLQQLLKLQYSNVIYSNSIEHETNNLILAITADKESSDNNNDGKMEEGVVSESELSKLKKDFLSNPFIDGVDQQIFHKYFLTDKDNKGLLRYFKSEKCISKFIKACGYLYEISKFYIVLVSAKECAKIGGDLLLYGFTRGVLDDHLRDLSEWVSMTTKLFKEIQNIAMKVNDELIELDKPKLHNLKDSVKGENKKENYWTENLLRALEIFNDTLLIEYTKCHQAIEDTRAAANSRGIEELFAIAKKATEQYIMLAHVHSNNVRQRLGKPLLQVPTLQDVNQKGLVFSRGDRYPLFYKKNTHITLGQGIEAFNRNDYFSTIQLLSQIESESLGKKNKDKQITFYKCMTIAYTKTGEIEKALSFINKSLETMAVEDGAKYYETRLMKGKILMKLNRLKEAEEEFSYVHKEANVVTLEMQATRLQFKLRERAGDHRESISKALGDLQYEENKSKRRTKKIRDALKKEPENKEMQVIKDALMEKEEENKKLKEKLKKQANQLNIIVGEEREGSMRSSHPRDHYRGNPCCTMI